MKQIHLIQSLTLSACLLLPSAHAQEVQVSSKEGARYATALGTAEVETAPDNVVIALAVSNWDKELRTAYSENSARTKAVIDLSSRYHIGKGDFQTNDFNVEPTYQGSSSSYGYRTSKPTGYAVHQKITIVLRKVDSLPSLLADAFEQGANMVTSIRFDTSNMRKLKDEARALAIQAAKEKAEDMALKLNAKIGRAIVVKEGITDLHGIWSNSNSNNNIASLSIAADAIDSANSVAAGALKVSSTVTVIFEMTD
jgi:uncharacterized protein